MDIKTFCRMIDHTLLAPQASQAELEQVCREARTYGFATIAIQPVNIPYAHRLLQDSTTGITSAIAYPHGAWSIEAKCHEIELCLKAGASDCDYVVDLASVKERRWNRLLEEAHECRKAVGDAVLKIILEVAFLSDEEIRTVSQISAEAGADFVKTSTGYAGSPTIEQLKIMRDAVTGSSTQVKAAGGFSTIARVRQALDVGVARIGTSSALKLIKELSEERGTKGML
jgi:deoxyribose-phosphate aldolase